MIADREYMREPESRGRGSVTIALVIANVLVFLVQLAVRNWSPSYPFDQNFALSLSGIRHGELWQLITFQFLHGGLLHLLLNCWALFLFGRELEEFLGRATFLKLYLFSGILGGVVQLLCALLAPRYFGGMLVGASAGVFGLVAAYAALFPEREFTVLIFFVIPVTLRAKMLLFWGAVIALVGAVTPGGNVAHAAHLGGMLGGLLFLNLARPAATALGGAGALWDRFRFRWRRPLPPPSGSAHWQRLEWDAPAPGRRPAASTRPDQFMATEVDPILDKIAAHGIQSLTAEERQILEQARARMAKR